MQNDYCGIVFHKNVWDYPKKWIDDFVASVNKQTTPIDLLEIDYGGGSNRLFKQSKYFQVKFTNHADAHNFLCRKAVKLGYRYVFNHNVDDFYHHERVYRQLEYMDKGYDVVSCNYIQMDAQTRDTSGVILFSEQDILKESYKGHNIIAHPGVCYSKNFIENSGLLIASEIPVDDYNLWKRSYGNFKFFIAPFPLLYYRIHAGNISGKNINTNTIK